MGIILRKDGFYIEPRIPSFWSSYTVECSLFNEYFRIVVRKGHNHCLKINGEKYKDKFIRFKDKDIKIIDLTI